MRYERPQRGRLREHFQFNCDIFGAPENLGEVEILSLLVHTLTSFGANQSQFNILLNDRRIVDHVFGTLLELDKDLHSNKRANKNHQKIDIAKNRSHYF